MCSRPSLASPCAPSGGRSVGGLNNPVEGPPHSFLRFWWLFPALFHEHGYCLAHEPVGLACWIPEPPMDLVLDTGGKPDLEGPGGPW